MKTCDFPILDMATDTMTLRLKCWRSRISLAGETSRFLLASAYMRSFFLFTDVATVNVFSSVNQMLQTLWSVGKCCKSCWLRWIHFILQSLFNCCPAWRLYWLSARSFFTIRWTVDREMPVWRSISRGLLWLSGLSSWLQISSLTNLMFVSVRTDFGRLLPGFLAAVLSMSIFLMRSSIVRCFYILFGNSFIIRNDPQCFWVRRFQIRQRSFSVKRPIITIYFKKTIYQ